MYTYIYAATIQNKSGHIRCCLRIYVMISISYIPSIDVITALFMISNDANFYRTH